MMRRSLILCFLALAGVSQVLHSEDSSEQFLSAYQAYQQGEKAEREGSTGDALKSYRFAESLLQALSSRDPSWQKAVVEYRLKKVEEGLSRLQGSRETASPTTMPQVSDQAAQHEVSLSGPSITITPPSSTPSTSKQQSSPVSSSSEVRNLRKLVDSLKSELQSLKDAASAEKSRSDDLDKMQWTKEKSRLEQQLLEAKDQIASLGEKLRKRDSWENDLKDLQKRLDNAVADKAATEEYYQEHDRKLAEASAELSKQLSETRSKIVAGNDREHKIEELTRQVEEDRESLKQLQAKLDHAVESSKVSEANNTELNAKIRDLTGKLAEVQKQSDQLSPLREKVAQLQKEALSLKKETSASSLTIQKMEKQASQREADFDALDEERDCLAMQVQGLGLAAKEASRLKGVEAHAEELKQVVTSLQQQLSLASRQVEEFKASQGRLDLEAKAARQKLLAQHEASDADLAVLEEERRTLQERLSKSAQSVADLDKRVQSLEPLKKDSESLRDRLAENAKALQNAEERAAKAARDLQAEHDHNAKKMADAESFKQLMENQNSSLQKQLNDALGKVALIIDKRPEAAAMQEQLSKLQLQLAENAKNYSESQKQLSAMNASRPEQEKLLKQREDELSSARAETAKLKIDLENSNKRISELQQQTQQGADRMKELQDQLADLSSKTSSGDKTAEAQRKQIDQLKSEAASSKEKLASLKADSQKTKELQQELTDKEAEIAQLKKKKRSKGALAEEKSVDENEVLRGIILRQVKEEAKKAQSRRLIEDEMKRLNVQSQILSEQVGVLSAPSMILTPEERALFKSDQLIALSDEVGGGVQASISAPLPASARSSEAVLDTNRTITQEAIPQNSPLPEAKQQNDGTNEIAWQGKFKDCLARAKDEFDRQDYLQAENSFKEALGYSPDDYFALSNLGVVEFQLGKLKDAEEALAKASQKKSDSSFALTTLGIVNYRQERLGDAEKTLRKAIAVNDQDFTAHNYLGIVLAASGNGKAGESEIMKAIEINKNYADAHFNLAVIYATGKPPSKMMAKKHYAKALELGAPPDPSLERLVQ